MRYNGARIEAFTKNFPQIPLTGEMSIPHTKPLRVDISTFSTLDALFLAVALQWW